MVVTKYDFSKPSKFAKNHIAGFRNIYEYFCKTSSIILETLMRSEVVIEIQNIREMPYEGYIKTLKDPVAIGVIRAQELQGDILMEFPPNIALEIIDKTLGGNVDAFSMERNLTEIEAAIIYNLMKNLMTPLKEAWGQAYNITPIVEKFFTTTKLINMTRLNDTIIMIEINVVVGKAQGCMKFCIPYETIKHIVNKIDIKSWLFTDVEPNSPEKIQKIEQKVELSKVDIHAVLGETKLQLKDIKELQVGDVITLDTNIKSELGLYIDGVKRYKARPGTKNKKLAVKITETIKKVDE